ncbi:MAG: dihydropteroate synthase [Candidatus Omnitrophica bacterium]|nr:dihydropteroate synthase [Candidatus Omnitrophota bacterium]
MKCILRIGTRVFDLNTGPLVAGILNVTPDSFSDGGKYLDPSAAADHARLMETQGAHWIDLGGESSRPGSLGVDAGEELRRILPVLRRLKQCVSIPVSVDTSKKVVMEAVLTEGAEMINDIRAASADPGIPELLARSGASVVLMHMRGEPVDMQSDVAYGDLVEEVSAYLVQRAHVLLEAGVARCRLVVDPGLGFGKSVEDNFTLLRATDVIAKRTGLPVMIGASRKSFIRQTVGDSDEALKAGIAVFHAEALRRKASILRVHDVAQTVAVIRMFRRMHGGQDLS